MTILRKKTKNQCPKYFMKLKNNSKLNPNKSRRKNYKDKNRNKV